MNKNPLDTLQRSPTRLILLIVILTFSAYAFMLGADFRTMDDEESIVNNAAIKDLGNIDKIFQTSFFGGMSYYRPLVSLSFMLEYRLFGLHPFYYYLDNLLLHTATAVLVFFLLNFIFKNNIFAFFTALLFAIHPVQWEAVANISGRAILLCTFFYLSAFFLFCRAIDKQRKQDYWLALGCFGLALLSKESAVVLPLVLFGYRWFTRRSSPQKFPMTLRLIAPFLAVVAMYLAVRQALGITNFFYWRSFAEALLAFLTFLRSLLTNIRLLVFPVDLHFDRMREMFTGFADPQLILTVLIFSSGLFALIKFRRKFPALLLFFILWFFAEFILVSQFLVSVGVQPGVISVAEHFLYVPVLAGCVVLTFVLQNLYEMNRRRRYFSKELFVVLAAGFFIFLFMTTVQQSIYASNQITMYERALVFDPQNSRVRNCLGLAYARLGLLEEAEAHFRRAIADNPYNVRARIGLGKALCDQGKCWEGVQEYEKIQVPGSQEKLLADNLKATYQILISQYKTKISENPADARLYYSLGVIYAKSGQLPQSIEPYHKAIALDSKFKNALFNLASGYEALREDNLALVYYERLLTLAGEPDHLDRYAYIHLGEIYKNLGHPEKAQYYVEQANKIPLQ
ncbi:MAG: hypothetical protein A2787_01485 [Omnitrophica WOR_2 bacterium RIFCSPHIGHO2_01_FULL_48_9]|nr:MAG: hypothetical protein A2787_01485 [Omnitrophica WOR_2 bacterium RIFCSPHIGHO2_01_FULL_48_9]